MGKLERQQNLKGWEYNTPTSVLFPWGGFTGTPQQMVEFQVAKYFKDWSDRISVRTLSEHHKIHWPNITLGELGKRIDQLKGIDFIVAPGIDFNRALYAGCLWIDHNRRFLLELVDGPATVRDLTYGRKPIAISITGDFDSVLFQDRLGELDLDDWVGTGISDVLLQASSFPISGVVLELSIYSYPVGEQGKSIIFWDYLRDDSEIPQRIFHWRV